MEDLSYLLDDPIPNFMNVKIRMELKYRPEDDEPSKTKDTFEYNPKEDIYISVAANDSAKVLSTDRGFTALVECIKHRGEIRFRRIERCGNIAEGAMTNDLGRYEGRLYGAGENKWVLIWPYGQPPKWMYEGSS